MPFTELPVIRTRLYALVLFISGVGVGAILTRSGPLSTDDFISSAICGLLALESVRRLYKVLPPEKTTP